MECVKLCVKTYVQQVLPSKIRFVVFCLRRDFGRIATILGDQPTLAVLLSFFGVFCFAMDVFILSHSAGCFGPQSSNGSFYRKDQAQSLDPPALVQAKTNSTLTRVL